MLRGRRPLIALLLVGCGPRASRPDRLAAEAPAPVPLAPDDSATVATARPTFRWSLPPGVDGAFLQICRDRRCDQWIEVVKADATSAEPTVDLPSGILFWRLLSHVGRYTNGGRSEARKLVIDRRVVAQGELVEVIVTPEQRQFGERLAALGDRAIRFFAERLGRPLPDSKSRVYFYTSREAFDEVRERWSFGPAHSYAITVALTGSHVLWDSRPDRENVEAVGWLETIAMHELAHAFQSKRVLLYGDQPTWLKEGVAELFAEEALSDGHGPAADRVPSLAQKIRRVRDAVAGGKLIPLDRLLDAERDITWWENEQHELFYAEVFALTHFLDSPSSPERQARFRTFLREVSAMRGFFAAWRINRRFRREFGPIPALERQWIDFVAREPLLPWRPSGPVELRLLTDGALHLETKRDRHGLAIHEGSASEQRLEATLELQGREAWIVFGYAGDRDFCAVTFPDGGPVHLWCSDVKGENRSNWLARAAEPLPPGLLGRGAHRIAVELRGSRVVAIVDGQILLDHTMARAPSGRWGLGASDGRAVFRDVTLATAQ